MTALASAEIAVLDGLQDLSLRAQDGVLRFRDVAINHSGEGGIFFLLEAAGPLEFSFTVHNPGVGRLFAVKRLRFAMNYFTALFDNYVGRKGLRVVFASPYNYASHGTT